MPKHIILVALAGVLFAGAASAQTREEGSYNIFVEGGFSGKISCFSKKSNAEGTPVVKGCMPNLSFEKDMVCKGVFSIPQPNTCVWLKETPTKRLKSIEAYMKETYSTVEYTDGFSI